MSDTIDISGLSKAAVLAALYNGSRPQGMGFLQASPEPMDEGEAQEILDGGTTYFDYLRGRVMKIRLDTDQLDPWGYDRDLGEGACERVITELRTQGAVNTPAIEEQHRAATADAVREAQESATEEQPPTGIMIDPRTGIPTLHMGSLPPEAAKAAGEFQSE